jgi:hypothetical protein
MVMSNEGFENTISCFELSRGYFENPGFSLADIQV